jgi:hypothetical protein
LPQPFESTPQIASARLFVFIYILFPKVMNTFSDEPVLIQTPRRFSTKHWIAIAVTLAVAGAIIYIPIDEARMDERAHHIARGQHSGSLYKISIEGRPHTIELAWAQGGFAIVLQPPPAPGITLNVSSRIGEENLAWNEQLSAFGPGKLPVSADSHYKVGLKLRDSTKTLWSDTLWAYAYHDPHGHSH